MANSHAELEKNDTKIIYPSSNSKVQTGNLTINGIPSENETKLSNQQLNMKLNQPSKNNDVFSSSNFEIMIPTDNANNSETELQSADKFNSIFRADNTSTSPKNDTHITATPPSILEIGSNQNSNTLVQILIKVNYLLTREKIKQYMREQQCYSMVVTVRVMRV